MVNTRYPLMLLLWLLISGCASAPRQSLYQQMGGQPGVEAVVELLLVRIAENPRIAHHFAGVDVLSLNDRLVEQLCFETGGPCTYTGKDMVQAHAHMAIGQADFNALVEDLSWAMDQRGIPRRTQNGLLKRLAAMYGEVVTR